MSISILLENAFNYHSFINFIPAAILCYLPMRNQLRWPGKRIFRDCVILFVVSYFLLQWMSYKWPWVDGTFILLPFLVIFFLYYLFSVRAMPSQCAAIYMAVCTFCAITSSATYLIEASIPKSMKGTHADALFIILEIALTAMVCIIFMPPFHRDGCAMVDEMQQSQLWITSLPFSVLTFIMMVAIPLDRYSLLNDVIGREIYMMIFVGVAVIYFFGVILFGGISRTILQDDKYKNRETIYRIQRKQYAEMKGILEKMRVFRHDTRHMIRTVTELAREGKTDEILRFLDQKKAEMPELTVRSFCNSSVLNAVLNFYLEEAERSQIPSEVNIDLPEHLTDRQTIDISSILANLLENAILACREIPVEKRRLALTVRSAGDKAIFIVGTNTFNGHVRMRRGEFLTTRAGRGGTGIGMRSMRSITERYRGTMNAYYEGNVFFVDIMMRVEKEKPDEEQ